MHALYSVCASLTLFFQHLNMRNLPIYLLSLAVFWRYCTAQVHHICTRRSKFTADVQGAAQFESFDLAWAACDANTECEGVAYEASGYRLKRGSLSIVDEYETWSYPKVCMRDGNRQQMLESDPAINRVSFDPSNHLWIAVGTTDGAVKTWYRDRRKVSVSRHTDIVTSVQFDPSGNGVFAMGSLDMTIRLTRRDTGELVKQLICDDANGANRVRSPFTVIAYAPDAQSIAGGCEDGSIWRMWPETDQCELIRPADPGASSEKFRVQSGPSSPSAITGLAFSPDRSWIAAGTGAGVVEIRSSDAGEERSNGIHAEGVPVRALSWSLHCQYLASGGDDSAVVLHNTGEDCGPDSEGIRCDAEIISNPGASYRKHSSFTIGMMGGQYKYGILYSAGPLVDEPSAWGWWQPAYPGTDQWLQIDAAVLVVVKGVIIQGGGNGRTWVSTFRVDISPDELHWTSVHNLYIIIHLK